MIHILNIIRATATTPPAAVPQQVSQSSLTAAAVQPPYSSMVVDALVAVDACCGVGGATTA